MEIGPAFNEVKGKIIEYNLENNVILKGATNPILLYNQYSNYIIFVLTSYREGLPLVLLEAKANKLPIVSFDIETGPNEIVENNVNGFLIEKYNIKEMAIRINELLKNKELRQKFSNNTYKNINKFKQDTIINEWINLINSI